MRYVTRRPAAPLSDFVEYFWSLADAPPHVRERVMPNGTVELVVNLDQDEFQIYGADASAQTRRFPGAMVSGCYGQSFGIDTRNHAAILGVHFRPGGAAGLVGAPPGELCDLHVALEDLWGDRAVDLRDRLCTARSTADQFRILEQELIGRLGGGRRGRSELSFAMKALERPGIAVGKIAEELQLSRRRFIEIFTRDVGMTPKRFARVRRFQRALSLATTSASRSWAQLAQQCGYYDQAHLCREWAELTGVSPSDLVALRAIRVKEHHLALPARGSHPSNTHAIRRA
jgi:AraC-like DNA-binding protein